MDVTCERCATEYEFDETLVSDRGTTVKCTHCGHLFKVFRPGSGGDGAGRAWTIRRRDGGTQTLTSLRELQRLITEGKLREDDEISRSGESWKRLGAIAELQTFFAAATAATPGKKAPERRDRTEPFTPGVRDSRAPYARTPSARPGAPFDNEPTVLDVSGAAKASPTVGEYAPTSPSMPGDAVGQGHSDPRKRTLFGVGGPAEPEDRATDPDPRRQAAYAQIPPTNTSPLPSQRPTPPPASSFPAGAIVPPVTSRPPAPQGRTGDRSVGRPDVPPPPPRTPPPPSPAAAAATRQDRNVAPTRTSGQPPLVSERAPATTRRGHGEATGPRPTPPPPRKPAMYVDEHAEVPRQRRNRIGLIAVLVVAVGLGVTVAVTWDQLAPLVGLGEAEDRIAPFVERGETALARDDEDGYREAIHELTRATAIDERDTRVLAGLARAHAALAQDQAFHASDLEARAAADPTLAGQAAALRTDSQRNASDARRFAEDAVRVEPSNVRALLVLADALRLTRDRSGAESHLANAHAIETSPSGDQLYVTALLAMDAANDVRAARPQATRAVETDGGLLRARVLLARALLADGDVAGARAQLDAIVARAPGNARAGHLRDAIDRGLPPAAPVVAVLDGGVPDGGTGAGTTVTPEVIPAEVAAGGGGGGGGGVERGRDYAYYVQKGDELLERGEIGRARVHYEAALATRANGPEANTGLGYVMLNGGNRAGAISRFQPAAAAGYPDAFIGLGEAYRDLGRTQEAIQAYRSYLSRSPSGRHAYTARRQLELLGDTGGGTGGGETPPPTPPTPEGPGTSPAPPTAPDELPAPRGVRQEDLPGPDQPQVGNE